ncbi:hypothetical protein SAMN05421539_1118 [Jannaschia seohaensis]|uniref:Uncharacterized protein n=1 Tax=Jannaschia seohaensis TaxID=475081 RepID=A0A2Y9C2J8_9RHOB|nr:hypothetical protein BCF38_1118 [Jannaschia seohaensis]SSA49842.1 hypothetical protein SAMN05421539_1118 [Jannaschia seohaensis]
MPPKKHKPETIATRLRQVAMLVSHAHSAAEIPRSIAQPHAVPVPVGQDRPLAASAAPDIDGEVTVVSTTSVSLTRSSRCRTARCALYMATTAYLVRSEYMIRFAL